jgi:hypothetical protein
MDMGITLDALYNGEIAPCEAPLTAEAKAQLNTLAECDQALGNQLEAGQRMAWKAYQEAVWQYALAENRASFAEGFRLGARLMLEALQEGEGPA